MSDARCGGEAQPTSTLQDSSPLLAYAWKCRGRGFELTLILASATVRYPRETPVCVGRTLAAAAGDKRLGACAGEPPQMNHRDRQAPPNPPKSMKRAVVFAVVLSAATGAMSFAQRAGVPADLKTATDVTPRAGEIAKFITAQLDVLKDVKKDDRSRERARDSLVRESGSSGAVPSASFSAVYASTLDAQLLPLAKSTTPARTRLLAVITLQRVAKSANNDGLANSTAAFAQDESPGVALWAMKAAQSILPTLAATGKTTSKLPAAIVEGVKKHSTSGDIADEAYRALTLDVNTKLINATSAPVIAQHVLRLFEFRTGLYVKVTPPRIELEQRGINFLTVAQLWDTKEGERLRPAIMQAISNLISVTAQHAAAREEASRKPFVEQLRKLGPAISEVGGRAGLKSADLQTAGKGIAEIQSSLSAEEFAARSTAVFNAIKKPFAATKAPPKIDPGASTVPDEVEIAEEAAEEAKSEGAAAAAAADGTGTGAASGSPKPTTPPKAQSTVRPKGPGPVEKPEAP